MTDNLFEGLDEVPSEPVILKNGVNYSHAAMIDLILTCPGISQNDLALHFGYSPSWISTIMASDAFQAALAERRDKIVDPIIKMSIEEQTRGLYQRSLEILRYKANGNPADIPDNFALGLFNTTARALGYGARVEPKPPTTDVAAELIKHADNLVTLLRRERKIQSEEIIDGQVERGGSSPHLLPGEARPGSTEQGEAAPAVQSGV